jgi:hypothetical protein
LTDARCVHRAATREAMAQPLQPRGSTPTLHSAPRPSGEAGAKRLGADQLSETRSVGSSHYAKHVKRCNLGRRIRGLRR